ncbi:MAG: cation:proton antiporter [Helicobacter sp.]|nr:cation:proton antiporter [Helicobacter sp.]
MESIESILPFVIIVILIVLATPLSNLIKIPIVVSEIMLGIFAGYFRLVDTQEEYIAIIANTGLLFLMFLCGMEVDLKTLRSMGKKFLSQALVYFLSLYLLSALVVVIFQLPMIFIALLPVMSLGMIMVLIRDYGSNHAWLNLALKIGILGEVVSITILTTLEGIYKYGLSWHLAENLIILLVFLLCVVGVFKLANILFWWLPHLKLLLLPHDDTNSQDIRFVIMLFVLFIVLTTVLELEKVLGAFIAGVILATYFKYKHTLPQKLSDFGFGFFVPFFFVYVGSTINLSVVFTNPSILLHALYLVIGMLAIRVISAGLVFLHYFKSFQYTLLFALSDCMPLTFLVITASMGQKFGVLSDSLYTSCIFGAIFEGIFFSVFIKALFKKNSM